VKVKWKRREYSDEIVPGDGNEVARI